MHAAFGGREGLLGLRPQATAQVTLPPRLARPYWGTSQPRNFGGVGLLAVCASLTQSLGLS